MQLKCYVARQLSLSMLQLVFAAGCPAYFACAAGFWSTTTALQMPDTPDFSFHFVKHGLQAVCISSQTGVMELLTFLDLTLEPCNPCFLLQDSLWQTHAKLTGCDCLFLKP